MEYLTFTEPPEGFKPTVEVASCYCEYKNKILLLKRHPSRPQGGTWGVPAGKLEKGESPREAVIREIYEEVGFAIDDDSLKEIGCLYIRLPHVDYVYHMFRKTFATEPEIDLGLDEHLEASWVTVSEALRMPLIAGGHEALSHYSRFTKNIVSVA